MKKINSDYNSSKHARQKRALEEKINRRMNYLRNCSDAELRHIVLEHIKKEN